MLVRRPDRGRRSRRRSSRRRAGNRGSSTLLAVLLLAMLGVLFQVLQADGVSTAVTRVPDSSADQTHPALAVAPVIGQVDEGDSRLTLEVVAPAGPAPEAYEYSTDGGVSWRLREDSTGVSTPVTITTTSTSATPLVNGTTYRVRLRSLAANGQGQVSNLVTATPRAPSPPPVVDVPVRWIPVEGQQHITTDPDTSAISFRGGGERRALVDMAPVGRATLDLFDTRFTRGNGWGVIVHGGTDERGGLEGYTVQFDRGFAGRVVVRYWSGGREHQRAIAVSDAQPTSNRPTDVRVEVDGGWLRVVVDGAEVLVVPDLPAAVAAAGGTGPIRADGVFGLRLWTSTNLQVPSAQLSLD
ncbi:MAG: hypothetical protein ACLFS9_01010 [Nitriliruptoraceae bacterium]